MANEKPTPKYELTPTDKLGLAVGAVALVAAGWAATKIGNPEAPNWDGPGATEQPAPQPQDLPPQGE